MNRVEHRVTHIRPLQQDTVAVHVLLVEDDEDLRLALADYLRLRGLAVTDVGSGIGYYKATRTRRFDVAILDVNLPDISGFEISRELSAERRTGIIILTARSKRRDRIQGYAEGADIFLTKPVDGEELVLAIQNLAKRISESGAAPDNPPQAPRAVSVASIVPWTIVSAEQRLVSPDAREIKLTGREMMVMQLLAQAEQGTTVMRSVLIELLGYENLGPESRGLDAVLRRLRQKAKDARLDLPLRSVHAMGVCFSAPLIIV